MLKIIKKYDNGEVGVAEIAPTDPRLDVFKADGWKIEGVTEEDAEADVPVEPLSEDLSIEEFVRTLDPEDDALWDTKGRVKMSVMEEYFGKGLTREDVETAMPGFTRKDL